VAVGGATTKVAPPTPCTYDPLVHERRLDIRGRDLNPYGHVNSAVYATYLEECRNELIAGVFEGIEAPGGFVLARTAIDYRRELTTEDGNVVVRCSIERIGTASVTFREEIRTGEELAAQCEAVIVAHDARTGRSRPISEDERAALESARAGDGATGNRAVPESARQHR
jgi:acyl-CoA thioester hydrolase